MSEKPSIDSSDWLQSPEVLDFLKGELAYFQSRYIQHEQRASTLASFSAAVISLVLLVLGLGNVNTLGVKAVVFLVIASAFLLVSLGLSLISVIPFSPGGVLSNLFFEFQAWRDYRSVIRQIQEGKANWNLIYDLVFRHKSKEPVNSQFIARIILRNLFFFKRAVTFRQITTTLSIYCLMVSFTLLAVAIGLLAAKV